MMKWLAAALLAASNVAFAEGLTLGAGVEYTTGSYGAPEKTDTLYVPFFGKYETGRWTLRLTVPWLEITGPGNVVGVGGDRIVLPGAATGPRRTESGLGDIVASAFYNVISERTAPVGVDLGAKVKFGTADETKGLGTGQNDVAVQADFFKPLGAASAFGSIGYRWYGDPPGVTLKDVFYFSIGGSYRYTDTLSAGLAYDYRPSITPNGGEISELTAFISQRVGPKTKLQPYLILGFGKASPDYGAGLQVSYAF